MESPVTPAVGATFSTVTVSELVELFAPSETVSVTVYVPLSS